MMELNPVRMLFWAAVINGFAAVPIMIVMMIVVSREAIMGPFRASRALMIAGWCATAMMGLAVLALIAVNLT